MNVTNVEAAQTLGQVKIPLIDSRQACFFQFFDGHPTLWVNCMDHQNQTNSWSLKVDIADFRLPMLIGFYKEYHVNILPNLFSALILPSNLSTAIQVVNLVPDLVLFSTRTTYPLGLIYTENLVPLVLNKTTNLYHILPQAQYRFIGFSTQEVVIHSDPDKPRLEFEQISVPSWIYIHPSTGELVIDATRQSRLGHYNLIATMSTVITERDFSHLTNTTDELMTSLISVGYVDSKC